MWKLDGEDLLQTAFQAQKTSDKYKMYMKTGGNDNDHLEPIMS